MRVLVTGATGFVGSVLVPKLIATYGAESISAFLLHEDTFPTTWEDQGVRCVRGDILDPESVLSACIGHTHVIHLAGFISYWRREFDLIMAVNRDGVRNIVSACIQSKISRLIHISSVGAIGFHRDGTLADEDTAYNWPSLFRYMESKHEGQRIVEEAVQQEGLDAVILNPASIMGPGDLRIETPHNQIYKKVYAGTMVGSFSGGLAVVDVRDLSEIIIKSIERGSAGTRYLVVGANVSYQEVLREIALFADRRVAPFKVPAFLLSVAGLFMELLSVLTQKRPLLTYAYGRLSGWSTYYTNQRSRDAFYHTYRSFPTTIKDSCAFFEKQFVHQEDTNP